MAEREILEGLETFMTVNNAEVLFTKDSDGFGCRIQYHDGAVCITVKDRSSLNDAWDAAVERVNDRNSNGDDE